LEYEKSSRSFGTAKNRWSEQVIHRNGSRRTRTGVFQPCHIKQRLLKCACIKLTVIVDPLEASQPVGRMEFFIPQFRTLVKEGHKLRGVCNGKAKITYTLEVA
jgi:hypothetical protein